MTSPTPSESGRISRPESVDRWRRGAVHAFRYLRTSLLIPVVLFATVALWIGDNLNPWKLGWIRPDEAATIAEGFLLRQKADLQLYTTVASAESRSHGVWSSHDDEWAFAVNPAVGYLHRFFRMGIQDSWTVGVSPTGQVYRVERQQYDDDPGARLSQSAAVDMAISRLASDLGVPTAGLEIVRDTLVIQPQRHDWTFVFAWPDTFGRGGEIELTLAGDAIAGLSIRPDPGHSAAIIAPPASSPNDRRVLGFVLILFGVFVAVQQHRTPLSTTAAAIWGGWVFLLTVAVRGLTFPQAMMLIPVETPYAGFLSRVALSAVVNAVQTGLLVGLMVATGDALWRDRLPKVPSLTRISPALRTRGAAWHRAARWSLVAAAVVVLVESTGIRLFGPVGLSSKLPGIFSAALSSPAPSAALPSLVAFDMLWDEGLYRLWLIPLLLLLFRAPLAIPLSAAAAIYFTGYDPAQFATAGVLGYALWAVIAGVLAVRFGIYAALLFHLYVLGAHAGLAMVWSGFGTVYGATLLALLFLVTAVIAALPRELPEA